MSSDRRRLRCKHLSILTGTIDYEAATTFSAYMLPSFLGLLRCVVHKFVLCVKHIFAARTLLQLHLNRANLVMTHCRAIEKPWIGGKRRESAGYRWTIQSAASKGKNGKREKMRKSRVNVSSSVVTNGDSR